MKNTKRTIPQVHRTSRSHDSHSQKKKNYYLSTSFDRAFSKRLLWTQTKPENNEIFCRGRMQTGGVTIWLKRLSWMGNYKSYYENFMRHSSCDESLPRRVQNKRSYLHATKPLIRWINLSFFFRASVSQGFHHSCNAVIHQDTVIQMEQSLICASIVQSA